MEIFKEEEKQEFINEVMSLYPFLSEKEAKEVLESIIDYWKFIIKNQNKVFNK